MASSIFPLALVATLVLGGVESEPRRQYGASCPTEDWCDYGKWLWCHSNTCQCLHPQRQTFDLVHQRCVALAGTECNVYIGDRDCTTNSFCDWHDGKGKCKCKPGTTQTSQLTCSNMAAGHKDATSSLSMSLPTSQNEIITITRVGAKQSGVKQEGTRPMQDAGSSWAATKTNSEDSGSGLGSHFLIARTSRFRSLPRMSNGSIEGESGSLDLWSSWRRFLSLLRGNQNSRIFFR